MCYGRGMTKKKDTLTMKQEKLVDGISENLAGKTNRTFQDIAESAGYTKESASNGKELLKSPAVQKRLSILLAGMDKARVRHLAELTNEDKIAGTSIRDHAYVMDILIKNQRLLSGESTTNSAIAITISESIAEKNNQVLSTPISEVAKDEKPA